MEKIILDKFLDREVTPVTLPSQHLTGSTISVTLTPTP